MDTAGLEHIWFPLETSAKISWPPFKPVLHPTFMALPVTKHTPPNTDLSLWMHCNGLFYVEQFLSGNYN